MPPIDLSWPGHTQRLHTFLDFLMAEDASQTSTAAAAGPLLCVMRHSVRLDSTTSDFAAIDDSQWPDRFSRPYDSPISDFELPRRAAASMRSNGLLDFDVVISSPFRRCLQTAAIVAKELSVPQIVIDNRLGEFLLAARRTWASAGLEPGEYTYAALSDAEQWSGGVPLLWERESHAVLNEADDDLEQRVLSLPHVVASAIARVGGSDQLPSSRVLIVTHGDVLNRILPGFDWDTSIGRYSASEGGWVAFAGHERLPVYTGNTLALEAVPRVIAAEGIERL